MTRKLLPFAAIVLVLAGCGGRDEAAAPAAPATGPASGPMLAVTSDLTGSSVRWVDRRTLEPVDARSAAVPFFTSVAERSPDGSSVAVDASESGAVQLVDLERMSTLGTIEVGSASFVERLHWVRPDLLLASLGGRRGQVAALDPLAQQVLSVHDLGGTVLYSQPTAKALVFLVAPSRRIGPARLAVFDGSELRCTTLKGVQAGWAQVEGSEDDYRARQSVPALAVDPAGSRALVIPAGNRVAEVDLVTMKAVYHDLAEPVSLLGRLENWLQPAAQAKAINGPDRNAVWLPSGLVAVSGSQYVSDGESVEVTPAGLSLVDPDTWTVRRLSDEPSWVALRGGALLASGWKEGSDEQTLLVFDPDGTFRFSLARDGADLSQASGGRLYAATHDETRFEIVDLETGRTVGRAAPKLQTWILDPDG